MLPTYFATGDGVLTWKVAVFANLISAIIFIITGFCADFIQKIIPAPALFGTLAGGSIALLGVNIFGKLFNVPIVGFVAVFTLLIIYLGNIKTKIPAPIWSMMLGSLAAWILQINTVETLISSVKSGRIAVPSLFVDFLNIDPLLLVPYLAVIVVFTIHGGINSLMGIKQAHESGDTSINAKQSMLVIGLINILSCFLGNPFPLGVFWGHNTWKELKASSSYSLATGILYVLVCCSGLVALVNGIIPAEATLPMLIFIALSGVTQAFKVIDGKYYPVIALTIILSIMEIMNSKTQSAMTALIRNIDPRPIIPSLEILTKNGSDAIGYSYLGNGALFIALIWGTIFTFVVDHKWKYASIAALVGAIFTFLGIIHVPIPGFMMNPMLSACYILVAIVLLLLQKKSTIEVNNE